MRAIITVTEYPSMPGRYKVTSDANKDRRGVVRPVDAKGAGAAAAEAMRLAINAGEEGYAIFGSEAVMKLIPADMRSR